MARPTINMFVNFLILPPSEWESHPRMVEQNSGLKPDWLVGCSFV